MHYPSSRPHLLYHPPFPQNAQKHCMQSCSVIPCYSVQKALPARFVCSLHSTSCERVLEPVAAGRLARSGRSSVGHSRGAHTQARDANIQPGRVVVGREGSGSVSSALLPTCSSAEPQTPNSCRSQGRSRRPPKPAGATPLAGVHA